ncbi:hypothetical protein [Portibacter marinus]|uniref:hypothetical protein n=1 Tax=Portibacter marinus TaxID=2898660 RepID=UPI001F1A819F|nr:hypothetical protein [Portibacter marinus]
MKYFIYSCLLLIICGCKTYSFFDEFAVAETEQKLPRLLPIINQQVIDGRTEDFDQSNAFYVIEYGDLSLLERSFRKYISESLTDVSAETKGFARLRINHLEKRNQWSAVSIISALSYGIPQLLGIPYAKMVVDLDISLDILDENKKVLRIYNAMSSQKTWVAPWYGYSKQEAKRKSWAEAVEAVIFQINAQIKNDFIELERQLMQ